MDYYGKKFKFDLQLFAATSVSVNLTSADTSAAATQYLVGTTWYGSVAEIPEANRGNIVATLKDKVLTVAVGTEASGNTVAVAVDNTKALTALKGYTIKTVNSFSTAGAVTTTANAASTVTIKKADDTVLGVIGNVSTGTTLTAATALVFAADPDGGTVTAGTVAIPAGCTVGDMTATTAASATADGDTFVMANAAADVVLVSGTATVKANGVARVGNNNYTNVTTVLVNAVETPATATITAASGSTMATLTSGTLQLGDNTSVLAGTGTASGTVVKNTATSGSTNINVTAAGVVSGLDKNDTFSISDSATTTTSYKVVQTDDGQTPATVNGAYLVASGNYSGVYKIATSYTDENLGKITVASVLGAADKVTDTGAEEAAQTLSPVAFNGKLTLTKIGGNDDDKDNIATYYKVTYNGTNLVATAAGATSAPAAEDGLIGYFQLTLSKDYNTPTATIVYHDMGTGTPALLTDLTIDFGDLYTADDGMAKPEVVVVSGLTTGKLDLDNVAQSVKTITGTTNSVDYVPGYALDSGSAITIPATVTNDLYFAVTVKEQGSATNKNVTTYQIGTATDSATVPTALASSASYFKYEKSSGKLTFVNNSGPVSDLSADCWQNVAVTSTANTSLSKINLTDSSLNNGTFAVQAYVGTQVDAGGTDHLASVKWPQGIATTKILYNTGSASTTAISIPETPASGTEVEYWKVEPTDAGSVGANANGNTEYTITKCDQDNAQAAGDYFTVTRDAEGGVKIEYTGDIQLYNLVTKNTAGTGTEPVTVAVDATDATAITLVTGPEQTTKNVDYGFTNVTPGVTVTNQRAKDTVDYKATNRNAIGFELAKLAETGKTVYYSVVQAEKDKTTGYKDITLGSKLTPTASAPAGWNYISITEENGTYTIEYTSATGATLDPADGTSTTPKTAILLSSVDVGSVAIDATGIASTATIQLKSADNVGANKFVVSNAAAGIAVKSSQSSNPTAYSDYAGTVNYIATYALADNAVLTVPATSTDAYYAVKDVVTKGKHVYTFYSTDSTGVSTGDYKNDSHFKLATDADGACEITFVEKGVTAANLAALSEKIKVDAAKVAAGQTLTLTKDTGDGAVGVINYSVVNLNKDATVVNQGSGDEVAYAKTYAMGTLNKLILGSTAGTQYYAVTAATSEDAKGVYTVSISETPIDLSPAAGDADKIAEILGGVGNYFKVVVKDDTNNTVEISYKSAATNGINLTGTDAVTGSGIVVAVDASGANDAATIAIKKAANEAAVNTYDVTGMAAGNTVANSESGATTTSTTFVDSYTITPQSTFAFADFGTNGITTSGENSVLYYNVVRQTRTATGVYDYQIANAQTNTTGLSEHYFKVTWATDYGIVITYFNSDGDKDYDLASTGKSATYNAAGLPSTINTIDITDTATNAAVNYALTNVPATVTTIEGQTSGDTVTYIAAAKLAADQKITLADVETQYFVVGGTATAATVTAAETKPEETANYFAVTRTSDGNTPPKYTYTMAYHASVGDTALDLSGAKSGTLTVDASALPVKAALDLANGTRKANYAIVNAKGSLDLSSGMNPNVPKDTVSYSTTVAWAEGTYIISPVTTTTPPATTATIVAGAAVTTAPSDTKTYLQVVVTKDNNGVYQITTSGETATPGDDGKIDFSNGSLYSGDLVLDVSGFSSTETFKLNATDSGDEFTKIVNVPKDAVITGIEASTVITTAALAKGESVSLNATPYFSGGGAISVTNVGGTLGATAGVFLVSSTDTAALAGSYATSDTKPKTIKIEKGDTGDGQVLVTYASGYITSITGLEKGETLTVTAADGTTSYKYTTDGTKITMQPSAGVPSYAAHTTGDILAQGYYKDTSLAVGGFKWVDGEYYVIGTTATGAVDVAAGGATGTATENVYYVKADVDMTAHTLYLTPYKGNKEKYADEASDYTGTITVAAENQRVIYVKGKASATADTKSTGFTVNFNNVAAQSSFSYLSANDTITTGTLGTAATDKITIITKKADGSGNDTVDYLNAASGTLTLNGVGLKAGSVKLGQNVTNYLADGTKLVTSSAAGTDVTVTVATDEEGKTTISSITGFDSANEELTITAADGTITNFKAGATPTTLVKTVTGTDGNTKKTELTISGTTNVWTATGTESIVNNFNVTTGGVGYFKFDSTGIATVPASTNTDPLTLTDGDTYVRAELTVKDGVSTIALTSYIVENGKLVEASSGATLSKTVQVETAKKLAIDSAGNEFKVKVTAAAAGSVFKNMNPGDIVATATDALSTGGTITVNGTDYVAVENTSEFTIYAETATTSRIVDGKLKLDKTTPSYKSSASDGSLKQTVTYAPGKTTDDGVTVTFGSGKATTVGGLENGSTVTVAETASGTTTTTIYSQVDDLANSGSKSYVYKTAGGVTTYTKTAVTTGDPLTLANITDEVKTDAASTERAAFTWTDSTEAASVAGYFLVSETDTAKTATVADQTAKIKTDYTQYGKTYLVATYTKPVAPETVGGLTLQKATVGADGALSAVGNLTNEAVDVALTVSGTKAFTYARPATVAVKSLAITGAGAGTKITDGWLAADSIKTAALAENATIVLNGTTYTSGAASNALEVKGTNLVSGTFRIPAPVSPATSTTAIGSYTDSDNNVTATTITYKGAGTDTVDVTMASGMVDKITGFATTGEAVQIQQTTTNKLGVVTGEVDYTYTAKVESGGSKDGQITVTRKNNITGAEETHTFTSASQNIWDPSVTWTASGSAGTSSFDWNQTAAGATGYFAATAVDPKNPKEFTVDGGIATQSPAADVRAAGYYLKVTTSKDTTGLVTVTGMDLVKRETSGLYTAVTGKVTTAVNVTAPADLNLAFTANTVPMAITGLKGRVYTGLDTDDTLKVTFTAVNTEKVTVGTTTYNSSGTAGDVVIDGSGAVKSGLLTVSDTVLKDEAGNAIVATKGDAVVTFAEYNTTTKTGGITNIGALAANESVTFTAADGTITKYTADASTNVTREITTTDGTETWTTTSANVGTNNGISNMVGYVPAKTFDFGATAAGKIGYFDESDAVEKTPAAAADAVSDGKTYVRVVASYDTEKKVYTITSLKKLQYVTANKAFSVANGTTAVSIASEGSMTLASDAIVTPEDTSTATGYADRAYAIAIEDAKAGETYTGFAATDTISTTVTTGTETQLLAGETITISDGSTKTVWTAGQTTSATLYGDGTAKAGTFLLNGTNALTAKAMSGTSVASTTSVTGLGTTSAQIQFADGLVSGIYDLGNGESVTVTTTEKSGAVKTETYSATGTDTLVIKKVTVKDGVTTTGYFSGATISTNVAAQAYDENVSADVVTQFDWTAKTGAGYFEVTPTITDGKVTAIGSVTVETQAKKTLTAGNYYLKVALTEDGKVDTDAATGGLTLVQVKADGTLSENLMLATTTGAITIKAPTADGLTFTKGTTLAGMTVAITGAADGSNITDLKAGDTVTTGTLAAPVTNATTGAVTYETVSVNGTPLSAGASTTMKFVVNSANAAVLSAGTVAVSGVTKGNHLEFKTTGANDKVGTGNEGDDVTIRFTQHNVTEVTALDVPVITVKNGQVTAVTGLKTTGSTVSVNDQTTTQTYGVGTLGITGFTTLDATLTTAALTKGTAVTCGTLSFTTAADGQAIIQNEGTTPTPTLSSGTIKFSATTDPAVTLTGVAKSAGDEKAIRLSARTTGAKDVIVKVQNGVVTSITGLSEGDAVVYGTVTYTAVTDTHITKVDSAVTPTVTSHAYITSGSDIFTASYIGDGSEIESGEVLEGQLSWNDVSGRSTGYFAIKESGKEVKTATIQEQTTKVTVSAPKIPSKETSAEAKYLAANVDENGTLTINGLTVTATKKTASDGTTTTVTTTSALDTTDAKNFAATDTITITAPTNASITYDKASAKFAVAINKLANGSVISNLATGDKVVTTTLTEGELVTVGGQAYVAGAKNALTIVGETNTTATDRTAGLLSGTIKLNAAYKTAVLAGTKDATVAEGDDVTVTVAGVSTETDAVTGLLKENVVVKVANGAVTSITGLETQNATVTVLGPTTAEVYTVLDTKGTMIKREVFAVSGGAISGSATETGFKTITAGKELYSASGNGYVEAVETDPNTLTNWSDKGTKVAYFALTSDAVDKTAGEPLKLTSTEAKAADNTSLLVDAFKATPENYYLRVTANTAASGVTTIKAVDLMQAASNGKLAAVKSTVANYYGTLTIDGAKSTTDSTYANDATISFALPKTRTWNVSATNIKVGSTFTNIGANDQITSAAITSLNDPLAEFKNGTYVLYAANGTGTDLQTVKIAGSDNVKLTESNGLVTGLSGLDKKGETVTLTTQRLADEGSTPPKYTAGETIEVYKVTAEGTVQRTTTLADGTQQVKEITGVTDAYDVIADSEGLWAEATAKDFQIVSNFDWTMDGSLTTYAAIKNAAATVKSGKVTVNSKNVNTAGYIALGISADGTVDDGSVKQVAFNASTGAVTEADAGAYTGKISITAPTTKALSFSRGADLGASIGEAAQIVITGAIAGSSISGLAAHTTYAKGDSVTTAALAKGANLYVDGNTYTATNGGKLTFTAQPVNEASQVTLTSGTIGLTHDDGDTMGTDTAYVGAALFHSTQGGVTVTATTNGKGVTTYTVGALSEGDTFTVETFTGTSASVVATYKKTGTTLVKTIEGDDTTYVYNLGAKNSVSSTILDTAKNWNVAQNTFNTDETTDMKTLVSGGAVTVDLAALDKRIAADNKADTVEGTAGDTTAYNFAVDTYLAKAQSKKANLAASVVAKDNLLSVQTSVGQVAAGIAGHPSYSYTAAADVAQTIKATTGWTVNGSDGADSITGAAKGYDILNGGKGDDTLTGGAAEDTFYAGQGTDVLKNYTTAKDAITFDTNGNGVIDTFTVDLNGTATEGTKKLTGVRLYEDLNGDGVYSAEDDTNSVLLVGMGNKKAVEVNGATYYFGSGTAKKAETFTYDAGAYYFGKENLANVVSVGTDKTKATAKTLGDTVTIDLNARGDNEVSYYNNITIVDASKSGNSVKLTALAETDTTLKGGTYTSTLVGGTGNDSMVGGSGTDVFWFDNLAGSDVVSGYASAKNDAVYLGDWDGESTAANVANGVTVQGAANNKDVILTNGTDTVSLTGALGAAKAVKISTDGTTANTVSYYVGSAASRAKNNFTATLGTDAIVANDKNVGLTSYYLGTETANAVDTLSIKTAKGQKAVDAKFSLADNAAHLSNIDVLDTSAINIAGSSVTLQGSNSGSFTLKGTNGTRNVTDRFDLSNLEAGAKQVTLTNLDVGEIIELAGNRKLEGSGTSWSITDDSGEVYGTVTLTGASKNAAFTKGTTTDGHVTYTRSVK